MARDQGMATTITDLESRALPPLIVLMWIFWKGSVDWKLLYEPPQEQVRLSSVTTGYFPRCSFLGISSTI